jgi:DNA-binding LacI/PurR family transcriptional regulator
MNALIKLKIKIPDEISIIGNDDIYYANIYPVPLTSIRAPQNEIGKKAAEILIKNIESSKILPIEKIYLKTEFILRQSSKILKRIKNNKVSKSL